MVAITKRTVDAAIPGDRDTFLWDDAMRGFGFKLTPAGGRVFVYQYRMGRDGADARPATRRYTIGRYGDVTPEQARRRAKELAAMVATGTDPRELDLDKRASRDAARTAAEAKRRMETDLAFDRYALLWLAHYEHEKARRPSSVRLARGIVENHLAPSLKAKPMPHVTRGDLQRVLDAIPSTSKGMRRAVHAYASVLFGWALKRGDVDANPAAAMVKPDAPKARDRVLTDDELVKVWRASEGDAVFGPFYRLLILTGQRRSEVAGMNWAEVDRSAALWTIPAGRAKNGTTSIVPLSAAALGELDAVAGGEVWPSRGPVLTTTGRTTISGFSKAKRLVDAAIAEAGEALPAWRVHDLRRTVATGFQKLGIRFEVTEAVLNHVSGARGGVAGIYQRHDWATEKRDALDAWARRIDDLLHPADAVNVVAIGAGRR